MNTYIRVLCVKCFVDGIASPQQPNEGGIRCHYFMDETEAQGSGRICPRLLG